MASGCPSQNEWALAYARSRNAPPPESGSKPIPTKETIVEPAEPPPAAATRARQFETSRRPSPTPWT